MNASKLSLYFCMAVISTSLVAGCTPERPRGGAAVPAVTDIPIPAGWVTYSSEPLGFEISHPPGMEASDNGTYSRIFAMKVTGEPARNFIYVSAVPSNFQSGDELIYNYDPAEAGMLLAAAVGESVALHRVGDGSEAQAADPFTYTRLPDSLIAGQAAKTYANDNPYEFPLGTQEIRIYLQTDNFTYLIGGYVDTTGSGAPGTLTGGLFNQMAGTFRLIR